MILILWYTFPSFIISCHTKEFLSSHLCFQCLKCILEYIMYFYKYDYADIYFRNISLFTNPFNLPLCLQCFIWNPGDTKCLEHIISILFPGTKARESNRLLFEYILIMILPGELLSNVWCSFSLTNYNRSVSSLSMMKWENSPHVTCPFWQMQKIFYSYRHLK